MVTHAEPEALTDTSSVGLNDPVLTKGDTHAVFTFDGVLPHRQTSTQPSTGVATFSEADLFKSKGAFKKPKAKRWDHRLSTESKARTPSSLKGAMRHLKPDTISLCGGLPSRYVCRHHYILDFAHVSRVTTFPLKPSVQSFLYHLISRKQRPPSPAKAFQSASTMLNKGRRSLISQ